MKEPPTEVALSHLPRSNADEVDRLSRFIRHLYRPHLSWSKPAIYIFEKGSSEASGLFPSGLVIRQFLARIVSGRVNIVDVEEVLRHEGKCLRRGGVPKPRKARQRERAGGASSKQPVSAVSTFSLHEVFGQDLNGRFR